MPLAESAKAAPAVTERDPQVDRLVGAINRSNSTPSVVAATTACHAHGCPRVEATRFSIDWRPTSGGILFNVTQLPQLYDLIGSALAQARRQGLVFIGEPR